MQYMFPDGIGAKIRELMASGRYESEDDLLRDAFDALAGLDVDEQENVRAVQEAIDEMNSGQTGIPADEFFRDLLNRHGLGS